LPAAECNRIFASPVIDRFLSIDPVKAWDPFGLDPEDRFDTLDEAAVDLNMQANILLLKTDH